MTLSPWSRRDLFLNKVNISYNISFITLYYIALHSFHYIHSLHSFTLFSKDVQHIFEDFTTFEDLAFCYVIAHLKSKLDPVSFKRLLKYFEDN